MTAANLLILTSVIVIALWLKIQFQFSKQLNSKKHFLQALVISLLWLLLILVLGYKGTLSHFDVFPPPFMFFFPCLVMFSVFLAYSKFGTAVIQNVTLSNLVLLQGFRVLAEIVLYLALKEGLAPVQLTFKGYNFDILTGLLAIVLGLYIRKTLSKKLIIGFNILGLMFLAIIAFIALTSMPTPLRIFMNEPSNVWVTLSPYILLPGILVVAAITGHLLIFRKLNNANG